MEVLDPKESQACQDHRDHQARGSQARQDCQENQGTEDLMDQKEILDQLVYQARGALQDHREFPAQREFLCQENLDNRDRQEPRDPEAFPERRVSQESLVRTDRKERPGSALQAAQVRGASQALRGPWDHPALLEWEREGRTGSRGSRASKAIGAFQEKGDQLAYQAPKVLLGSEDQKALESQAPPEPQASQGFQEPKATPGLRESLGPQGLPALGSRACQAFRDKEDPPAFPVAPVPKGSKAQQAILGSQVWLDPLEMWDPKDQRASRATMECQALKASQGQLGLQDALGLREKGVPLA